MPIEDVDSRTGLGCQALFLQEFPHFFVLAMPGTVARARYRQAGKGQVADHHHQQHFLFPAGQANRLRPKLQRARLFFAVFDANHLGRKTQPTTARHFLHRAQQTASVNHRAHSRGADHKSHSPLQQRLQHLPAVTPAIDRPDPSPAHEGSHPVHRAQQFRILPVKMDRLSGMEFLVKGRHLTAVNLRRGHFTQPVTLMHLAAAPLVDPVQVLHLPGVLLAHVTEVQTEHRLSPHVSAAHLRQAPQEMDV